jgi:transposase
MMRPSNDLPAVYLCRDIVDFRKGINSLAILVEGTLELDPFSEQLFVFCNRKRDKVKILYWERNGYCLWQKSLERAKFKWPRKAQDSVITLTGQQLNWLLDGYDIMRMQAHERLHYHSVL